MFSLTWNVEWNQPSTEQHHTLQTHVSCSGCVQFEYIYFKRSDSRGTIHVLCTSSAKYHHNWTSHGIVEYVLPLYNLKHLCLIISIYVMFTLIQTHVTNLLALLHLDVAGSEVSQSSWKEYGTTEFGFIASKRRKTELNRLENNDANYIIL